MRFPIHIALQRSRRLLSLLVLVHALAAAAALMLPWPAPLRASLVGMVAVSLILALQPSRAKGLRLGERGELSLLYADGDPVRVVLCPESTVFSCLIVLRVHDDGKTINCTLLPDSMPPGDFRWLRLWLRWHPATSVSSRGAA